MFPHNGTWFILERQNSTGREGTLTQDEDSWAAPSKQNIAKLIVRCFGHSNAPVLELFAEIRRQSVDSTQFGVTKIIAGSDDATTQRTKRPLSSIDLEPELKERITHDVQMFSEDSRDFYETTSQPYRRGYLLHGPPGTGKKCISVAIASHFSKSKCTFRFIKHVPNPSQASPLSLSHSKVWMTRT